jgi:hypothetical protein
MSAEATTPLPLDPALLARFRQQAAALIAHERGLTPTCRVKLADVAQSIGIAESQVEEAIRSLTAEPEAPPNPQAERFRRRLRKDLTAMSRAIIDPPLEAKIIAAASSKYALSDSAASDVLAEVAAELGLTRITASDAVQNLVAQIDQALGDGAWLAREAWDRLRSAGAKWGLSPEVVDELIRESLAKNRDDYARRSVWTNATLIGAGTAVLAVCLVLGGLILSRSSSPVRGSAPASNELRSRATTTRKSAGPPAWWDVDLAVDMAHAKAKLGGFVEAYRLVASAAAGERAAGYERLLEQVLASPEDSALLAAAGRIVAGCYALEPDEPAAARIRNALVAILPAVDRRLPVSGAQLRLSLWAADTASTALHRRGIAPPRSAALAAALNAALGGAIDPAAMPAESKRLVRERTILASFQQFTAAAARQPKEVAALYPALAEAAAEVLSEEEFARAETSLLVAALPAAGDRWTAYERPLARAISSPDPLPALRLLEALRRATQPCLVDRLSELLLVRAGARTKSHDKKEVILAVRKALGGAASLTAADRWLALQDEAAAALASPATSDEDESLSRTVQLTHLTTLAIALSQGEAGFATFDAGLAEPPQLDAASGDSVLKLRTSGAARAIRRLSRSQQRDLARYLATLDKRGVAAQPERESALRGLALLADETSDINPTQAATLARYLLSEKSDGEQAKSLSAAAAIKRWRQLRLAVADSVASSSTPIHAQRDLAVRLLSGDLPDEYSSAALRRALLADVAADLETALADAPSTDSRLDAAAELLAASYRQRAALLSVSSAELAGDKSTGQVLERVLTAMVGSSGGKAKDDLPARLPAELRAARYLAAGDLQYTVAVQRLLLEASRRRVAAAHPRQAAAAKELVAEAATAARQSTTALAQLHTQEAALLKLWLLSAPEA